MSAPTTITTLSTYRNETPYPFCPGCGHHAILAHLNTALVALALDPAKVVLVSDIGCSGLSDQYFATSAFHGLHGRSITYATGIKLARPDLTVIVIMGDGGTGIGGAHLLNAARRNIGLTVLVFNNFNFGMTGGQHSTTTPPGAVTSTTPGGSLERPLDICATVAANGASYVWRGTSFDADLPSRIAEAVRAGGFGLLDIWELCTAYFVHANRATKRTLAVTMKSLGLAKGLLHRADQPEYAAAYREAAARTAGQPSRAPKAIVPRFTPSLDRTFRLVIAGSAGAKVRSAARLVGEAAVRAGLYATQRDDYPITVKSGHSIAELVLARGPIDYTGITRPDALILLSAEGASKMGRQLAAMTEDDVIFALPETSGVPTRARIVVIDPDDAPVRIDGKHLSLFVVASALMQLGLFPLQALEDAAGAQEARRAAGDLDTIRAALSLRTA